MDKVFTENAGGSPFADDLVKVQFDLYAYIVMLMSDSQDANDVLQETNRQILAMKRPREEVRDFFAWAKTLAYYQVKAWRSKQTRDRLLLSDTLFDTLSQTVPDSGPPMSDRAYALGICIKKLPPKMREYFLQRYVDGLTVREIAGREGRSTEGLSVTLHRTRLALRDCILKTVAALEDKGGKRHA